MSPPPAQPHLYLVDGHSLIYRAFFAIRGLSTSRGLPTNAAYGFTNMLIKLIRDRRPEYLAVAMDSKGPTLRHAEFADYKAQRPEMPDTLQQQIPVIQRIVSAFRIPLLMMERYEADDLIGTLSAHAEKEGIDVTIVTGDKDLFQLIGPKVHVYDSMKDKTYETGDVLDRFGVEPSRVVEIMGLMGDSIDNIPGVPGIGEKTAVKLIKQFGTIDNLLENIGSVRQPKLRQSLEENAESARASRRLAMLHLDCPIHLNLYDYERKPPDGDEILKLFQELEFTGLLKRLDEIGANPDTAGARHETMLGPIAPFSTASDPDSILRLFERIRVAGRMVVDPIPGQDGFGLAFGANDEAGYLDLEKPDPGKADPKSGTTLTDEAERLLGDPEIKIIGHRLKDLVLGCLRRRIPVRGLEFDSEIASYLLTPNRRDHTLETVSLEHIGLQPGPVPGGPGDGPGLTDQAVSALSMRIHAIFRLEERLSSALADQELISLFREIEMPLIPVLAEMEHCGIRLDVAALREFSKELEARLHSMTERIYSLAGEEFNINSPKQLSKVLFENIGLKPVRKTKTGFSTNEEVLQQLAPLHELPSEVLNYRQLTKLKSTYVDALPELVDPGTGRLHTSFNQTATATGRLSSTEPNLQNIPIKGDLGKRLRGAFIADKGFKLFSFDYNQIELRILAHLSGDERLTDDFRKGNDIHTSTAMKIFGLGAGEITTDMRRMAKSVNFGIVYGISAYGLSTTLQIPQDEAKRYIDSYFSHYHGVQAYIERIVREATDRGYVTTIFSRRRPIPELTSRDRALHALGERTAVNTVIQGSAADLIKLAMIRIAGRIRERSMKTRMLLQIHDELLFEVPDREMSATETLVRTEMEGVLALEVPLGVDTKSGGNWGEL